jgi:glucose-1-phosphate cytidylyltransferase
MMGSGNNAALFVAILCGGRGARLRPLTKNLPKPMVEVKGRPMLDHILDFYEQKGIRRFALCAGYRADVIRDHYASASRASRIDISEAGEDASMLERIWALREESFDRLLIAYGDTFIDLNLDELVAHHEAAGSAGTIVTAEIRSPFGLIDGDPNGLVSSFREKPVMRYYIGCALLERAAFDEVTDEFLAMPDGDGLVAFFQRLISLNSLGAYLHTGLQLTYNSHEEYARVESEIGKFYTFNEGP